MEAVYAEIRDGLRRLREAAPIPKVFGSESHRSGLVGTLSEPFPHAGP